MSAEPIGKHDVDLDLNMCGTCGLEANKRAAFELVPCDAKLDSYTPISLYRQNKRQNKATQR